MSQDLGDDKNKDQSDFDLFEKTKHTGELTTYVQEGSGFALNAIIGGSYRVIEFIGEGGMGLVYKVEHIVMNKTLALKVLKTEQVSEIVWKRFQLEAQAISRLDHPNIIKIYDMNQTADGRPFYTMELLSGQSLADYLQEHQRLALAQALPLFRQVCSALAYAHERGIIHRDIKPGNIMLINEAGSGSNSRVKIVDFGIVKMVDERGQLAQGLTRQGEVFGSPLYMSPEQCAGRKLDGRADMYSVGVSLFQALTGRPPLVGRTAAETTIMHHTTEPPSLAEVGLIEYPPALEELVAKMLAKEPDDRYKSLSEVAQVFLSLEGRGSRSDSQTLAPSQNKKTLFPRTAASASRASRVSGISSTSGDTGGLSSTSGLESSVAKPLVAVGAVFAAVTIALVFFFNTKLFGEKANKSVVRPAVDHQYVSKIMAEAGEYTSFDTPPSEGSDEQVVRFLNERKAPYLTVARNGITKFSFPEGFCIGSIGIADASGTKSHKAQGTFETGSWRELSFASNAVTLAHPELLKFFPPNSLSALKFCDLKPRSQILIDFISQQRNLVNLQLGDSTISESDFKIITSLNRLVVLTVETYNISPKTLFDCKLLRRLDSVGLIGLRNGTPLLEALVSSKNLRYLILTNAKLSKRDVAAIARMTQLRELTVNGTDIDDRDLQKLLNLRDLSMLNVTATKITVKSDPTLRKFQHLKHVTLPPDVSRVFFSQDATLP